MKTRHILAIPVLLVSGCASMFGPPEPPTFQEVHEKCMLIDNDVTTKAEIIHHFGKPLREFHSKKELPSEPYNRVLMYYFYVSMNHSGKNHQLTILIGEDERVIKHMHERMVVEPKSQRLNMEALKQLRKGSTDKQDIVRLLGTPTAKLLGFDGNIGLQYNFKWETDSAALRRVLGTLLTGPYMAYELITGNTGTSSGVLAFMLDENGKLKSVSYSEQKGLYDRKDSMILE